MGDLAEEAALEGLLSRVTWMWCQGADGSLSFSVYPAWCPARGVYMATCLLAAWRWDVQLVPGKQREGSFLGLEE